MNTSQVITPASSAIKTKASGAMTVSPKAVNGVSVVVPFYNEFENAEPLYRELCEVMSGTGRAFELIFVDDGSTDGTVGVLRQIAADDPNVQLILFRKNYGQTSAMKAGIDHAGMDAVITMDGDRQNDPADIPQLISVLEEGYDLVHGWRKDRQDALLNRKIPSRIANRLISQMAHFPIHDLGCTLKAMRREILQEIELYGDMHRFIPILMYQRGALCCEVVTRHRPRVAGKTKYGIGRTITVLLDLLTVKYMLDYSAHPMRIFGGLGLICMLLSALSFLGVAIMKFASGTDMTGNPLLLLSVVAGVASLQLLSLGILGEVLARIYYGSGRNTFYAVREFVNTRPPAATGHDGDDI